MDVVAASNEALSDGEAERAQPTTVAIIRIGSMMAYIHCPREVVEIRLIMVIRRFIDETLKLEHKGEAHDDKGAFSQLSL